MDILPYLIRRQYIPKIPLNVSLFCEARGLAKKGRGRSVPDSKECSIITL
jgi:hypothetical protein